MLLCWQLPPPREDQDDHNDQSGGSGENKGTLIMNATCCPADISCPQDFQLLNEAREKLEHIVDVYCEAHKLKKPRMRRRAARKDYLKLSKCKKRTAKKIREGVRKQLQYIRRDIGFIVDIIRKTHLKASEKLQIY